MKPINGPGAGVVFFSVLAAALVVESSIAAAVGCVIVALGGFAWDIAHGNWEGNKEKKKHR